MSGYDLYILFLCVIVFTLLTVLFSVMLHYIIKLTLNSIKHGLEDERITKEYRKSQSSNVFGKIASNIITAVLLIAVVFAFAFSVAIQLSPSKVTGNVAIPKVVLSSSMSIKNKENDYLIKNDLNDQFDTFDLIFTEKLPDEFDLKLYDIVVYEYHGQPIVHRIVHIEEPNAEHPDKRHFMLRGDAVKYSDEYPVLYEQMRAIYRGKHVKFVGSFFAFMQSPAGYLCILLIIFAVIATPIAEKKLLKAKRERLMQIGVIATDESSEDSEESSDKTEAK
ncbi:MAG: hypothetical protein IJF54_05550 [Clostridia bacterium]|nr:hypothetical protein [Clostridia bacterium]